MKFTKKCDSAQHKISISNRRRSSAGMFYTSSAGAVTSLILIATLSFLSSAFLNITGFTRANTYADSISMTVSTDNLTINMAPMSSSGEFAKSGNMNIAVSTTSSSGYNLSIASSTGNTNLTSGSNSIASISSAISESTFSSSSTYNNQWGYKPSNLYSSSTEQIITNTDFRPLPGTAGEIIAKTKCANGTSPCTNPVDNYTLSIGTRTTNTTPIGNYISDTFVITAVTNKSVIECDSSKLCVQYNGNGLSYPETSSQLPRNVNNVNYNSTIIPQTITKYSHTPNVSDAGIASGTYSSSMNTTDTVTIDGATSLNVTIYYDAESTSYDWVSVYQSPFDISNTNDATVSTTTGNLSGKLSGRNSGRTTTYSSWYTKSYTVSGDTVKFHFKSDSSGNYYGYYAIITGTSTAYERSVSSGEYATPTGTNSVFHGWSTSQTTPGGGFPSDVEYTNESEILTKIPGDEGETKTLYAVWQQGQTITFTMDSNITKIDVLDASGATVGTITSSGQSLNLAQGDTYTIKPTHTTGYGTNAITKTSGAGTLNGKQFTVGAGAATINVTSKPLSPMQNWTGCSSLAQGDTKEVYDTRDNETYLIGKLKDGKCWMLENLNISGGTALSSTDTDFESTYTLPTTNGWTTSSGKLVLPASSTSGFSTNNYAYVYNSGNKENCGASGQNTPCYSYYSWDAATLGSGRSISANDTDAPYSICPKGWKLPTAYTTSASNWQTTSDFYVMAHQYGLDSTTSTSESDSDFYNQAGPGTLPNFLLAGNYGYGSFINGGNYGSYWSATSGSNTSSARYLVFSSSSVNSANSYNRCMGYSVRCVLGS
ncbi:hypothetical protein IJJ02_03250 [Candidatus Saccharibacteria bacterium]|nr:hypothetical protein [Candidatus Saccharibacteria bacterium]